jgi:hypothetical protein
MGRSRNHETSGAKAHFQPGLIVRAEALTHKSKIAVQRFGQMMIRQKSD